MNLIKYKQIFILLTIMLFAPLFMGCDNHKEGHNIYVDKGAFFIDSTNFVIASAEFGYARNPRCYWKQRLQSVKDLGVNTVMVRVPWVLHEPNEGVYNFNDNNDVREFCKMAHELGLLVWLHVGPYSDAHADMGGLPWWLLKNEDVELRSLNESFMQHVGRYFRVLGKQLVDMQLSNGGPIALVQIEEPEGLQGNVKEYLAALCDSVKAAGFDKTLLTLAAYKKDTYLIPHNKAVTAIAINDDEYAMKNFSGMRKIDMDAPMLCYDISRSCAHRWSTRGGGYNLNNTFLRIFELFEKSVSLNTGSVIGGTSFGHLAGAEIKNGKYYPYSTSYDNGAIIKENGYVTDEHNRFRDIFRCYASGTWWGSNEQSYTPKLVSLPEIEFTEYAPIGSLVVESVKSDKPLTMEQCDQGYGAMLYTAKISDSDGVMHICVEGIHDNAQLFHNGKLIATSSRVVNDSLVVVMNVTNGDEISILVDAMGRVGNVPGYKDYKGITGGVKLLYPDGTQYPLKEWENNPLSADYTLCSSVEFGNMPDNKKPGIYRATFKRTEVGDTYLFVGSWGRGEVWVNGHSLGRFWNIGPQQMLYLPGCWLHDGENELIVLDWVGAEKPIMEGFKFAPAF